MSRKTQGFENGNPVARSVARGARMSTRCNGICSFFFRALFRLQKPSIFVIQVAKNEIRAIVSATRDEPWSRSLTFSNKKSTFSSARFFSEKTSNSALFLPQNSIKVKTWSSGRSVGRKKCYRGNENGRFFSRGRFSENFLRKCCSSTTNSTSFEIDDFGCSKRQWITKEMEQN